MGKNVFSGKHFHDEEAARQWFEAARWPDGPVCPTCGSLKHYATKKAGRYRCGEKECRKDFTVMTKSVMERSHAKLTQWAAAFCMYAASRKGFTALQLQRHLGCQDNTTWFLHHRVMQAMPPVGLHTDESKLYPVVGAEFAAHETVNHAAREYARGDVTTNTVEGFFGIFKRGMRGNYQHCAEKNLHRYLAEFDFRYNTRQMTDGERAVLAVQGGEGKRLTYRQPR